ncbi:MAG: GntR family transcriptional regulator [Bacillota bacterium]
MEDKPQGYAKQVEIENYIIHKIKINEFKEGTKIPSENELSTLFKVNRHTVRKAIERVRQLGWLYAIQGKGCFVRKKPSSISYPIVSKGCFSDNLNGLSKNHASKLINWTKQTAQRDEIKALKLSPEENVYRLDILRYVDEVPIAVYTSVLPEKVFPGLECHLGGFYSLFKIIRQHYGFSPVCKYQTIEATFPSLEDMELLEITNHISILKSKIINIHPDGMPVEYCISRIRGDRYKYTLRFNN